MTWLDKLSFHDAINLLWTLNRQGNIFLSILTFFFPMFPFDPSENTRKPKVSVVTKGFLMFSDGSKGNIGKKRVKPMLVSQLFQYGDDQYQ